MTEAEAKIVLGKCMCDKCYSKKCDIKCDYAKAHDVAIKSLDQVAKLRELRNNLEEKERFYEKELYDRTLYSKGLADAYCTTNALIDEILGE